MSILPSMLIVGAVALAAAMAGDADAKSRAPSPVVVELYQSQGCSSCPPANANLNAIADRTDVLPLSFAVTYWDQLGWKDTFARTQFTSRQWDYARAAGRHFVATPQVVINGRRQTIVGGNRAELESAVAAARRDGGPAIAFDRGRVTVGGGRAPAPATVWLVRYDPRNRAVPIRAGENGGRTLPHRNIVQQLVAIGTWSGRAASFGLPPSVDPALRTAILVQRGKGGQIAAAARL